MEPSWLKMFFMERFLTTYSISVIVIESDFVFLMSVLEFFSYYLVKSTYKHKVVFTTRVSA